MFSQKESKQLREQFWISFGKSFPRKWILYNTKVKGLSLKFHFDMKGAMVSLDVEGLTEDRRAALWDNLLSLKTIIGESLPNAQFEEVFILENQKVISRIYVQKEKVSIHDKNTWEDTMIFFKGKMSLLEEFFLEYQDVLKN
ncbi:DUF4268 domain-containing protein [Muriicola sp.]|uniref:DUF4268 domain-containing protein n=1 Tax=Muriicola sp. TaxID=2020856 RepID=UPI003C7340E8